MMSYWIRCGEIIISVYLSLITMISFIQKCMCICLY